jgi:Mrp family chromosome partitioning ATPase
MGPYLRAITSHKLVVALIVLVALGSAAAYLSQRGRTYSASAEILVTPLPQSDTSYQGLQLLRDYGEATRTIQTAATLVESPTAADLTAQRIGEGYTGTSIENAVDVGPKGESDVLSVTAEADTPELAAKIANTYASTALEVRRSALKKEVDAAITRTQGRIRELEASGTRVGVSDLASTLSALEGLRDGDPTLSISQSADLPTNPSGASKQLILALALLAGLLIATGVAVLLEMTERAVRDEDELLEILPAPVLTRVPVLARRALRAGSPTTVPPAIRESFRTLRVQLELAGTRNRTVMVTSASSGDGKTSSAINLALSLVGANHRVLLMDFDLRKPDIASRLGMTTERSLVSTLTGTPLSELMTSAPGMPPLNVVTAASTEGDVVLLESLRRRLPALLEEASALADFVVIDTSPVGEVSDALTILDQADDILIVARPGHTSRANLENARELLATGGVQPTGLIVLGERPGTTSSYYELSTPRMDRRAGRPLSRSN